MTAWLKGWLDDENMSAPPSAEPELRTGGALSFEQVGRAVLPVGLHQRPLIEQERETLGSEPGYAHMVQHALAALEA